MGDTKQASPEFEKKVTNFLCKDITLKTAYLGALVVTAFNLGVTLATHRWKPNTRDLSNYVEQGIRLQQHIDTVQGGNEVLNPIYYVRN